MADSIIPVGAVPIKGYTDVYGTGAEFPAILEETPTPQPAIGVPKPSTPTTSGANGETSTGNGGFEGTLFSGNIEPSPISHYRIKEKILRPAQTSQYQCWFNPPTPVLDWIRDNKQFNYNGPGNPQLISWSCSEALLPGSSFMTNEITDDYHGVTERHAYRRAYDDRADFTFYIDHGRADGNYNVLWFFEKWMQYIANEEYGRGLVSREFNYRVRFPNQYQTDQLFVNKFERDFKGQFLQYKFMQAYPISINSIPVSYDSSQLLKCTVSFTYSRYISERKRVNLRFTVVGATQLYDGSWSVELQNLPDGDIQNVVVSNEEYYKKYAPK